MKKVVLLGVTSGIAAYKTLDLVKKLREEDIDVFVIMTDHAAKMVNPKEFEEASGHKVSIDLFEENFDYKNILKERKVDHIDLADRADVMIIAPATANIIGKLANGIAEDFLTTTTLAVTAPIIICPSMNVNMWNNPVVVGNVKKLKTLGYQIIKPTSGMLACGYEGEGRLENILNIKQEIITRLNSTQSLAGKKIIITAGGTIEKIDDVRYIANRASGKMGAAIAEECFMHGAEMLLLRAKNSVKPRYLIKEELFTTADELYELVKKYAPDYDYFYHTAAVSDFTVEKHSGKLSSDQSITLSLKPQIKILDQIKKLNSKIKLIAFKAESNLAEKELIETALKRMKESNSDAIVANDVGKSDRGFEADNNEVYIILRNGDVKHVPLASKKEVAKSIVDYLHND
jgi:phosphopantothenoylcysteine decarboxylase/phosphopantothenate--cysteine ligase